MPPAQSENLPRVVITGALGFIGSCLVAALHRTGRYTLVLSDDFSASRKFANLQGINDCVRIDRGDIAAWISEQPSGSIQWVIHIGARTDTTEFDQSVFDTLNISATHAIWEACTAQGIPLIYASSAATYGDGAHGYTDDHAGIEVLRPLNPYGWSKQVVDQWVLKQTNTPPHWYGLKFFNVYGPNEYHKGRMASVIMHAYHQMRESGRVKLFRSHRPDFADGYQLRDFIYVKDVIAVLEWLMQHTPTSGIYNLGTGKAESFYQLAASTATAMQIPLQIDWIDIPADIRDTYQYFTEADMSKLRNAGYTQPFATLSEGAVDYVRHYLMTGSYY